MAGKEINTVEDIWQAYVKKLLKEDLNRYTRYEKRRSNHAVYVDINGTKTTVMTYSKFRKILEHFFDKAKREVINGGALVLPGGLGRILVKRVERDFRKKNQIKIDWNKTKKQPLIEDPDVPGKLKYEKHIYNTQPDWLRISWIKSKAMVVENIGVYKFSPTNANKERGTGFKLELTAANNADPFLKYKYLFQGISNNK